METETKDRSVTQTIYAGAFESPATFSKLLLVAAILFGVLIGVEIMGIVMNHDAAGKEERELRMLDNTLRDMQSVLISRGYAKPSDFTKPADIGTKP